MEASSADSPETEECGGSSPQIGRIVLKGEADAHEEGMPSLRTSLF
jgi:hypothetical protein